MKGGNSTNFEGQPGEDTNANWEASHKAKVSVHMVLSTLEILIQKYVSCWNALSRCGYKKWLKSRLVNLKYINLINFPYPL